jgi:mono/diheme cytochrome c family protein
MNNVRALLLGGALLMCVGAHGDTLPGVENPARAQVNYMLNCQGCHGADGVGTADGAVPVMKDFVGNFLSVSGGRAFLVRVPGSANAALSDQQLAEVLNWMLPNISPRQIPADFTPYSAAEVAALRRQPLADVEGERARLVARMEQDQSL